MRCIRFNQKANDSFIHKKRQHIGRDSFQWAGTVPTGYNATRLREKGVKMYAVKRTLHTLGVETGQTEFGRTIKLSNREQTVCHTVRSRHQLDRGFVQEIITQYVRSEERNHPLLFQYAESLL